MKIEHEIKEIGKIRKITAYIKDNNGKLVDDEISIIVKAPDGLEVIYLPPDTNETDDKDESIYGKAPPMFMNVVTRKDKGTYEVVFTPISKGEHEGIIVAIGNDKIEDYRFTFEV